MFNNLNHIQTTVCATRKEKNLDNNLVSALVKIDIKSSKYKF